MLPLLGASPSRAAEWSMDSSVDLAANYNDNIALTPAPHPTVWGLALSPAAVFSGETETLKVNGGLRLRFVRYYGEEGLDHNDIYFTSQSTYKSERDVLGLDLAAIRDPTLVTELATTGVVTAYRQRTQLTANPSWRRLLTEATALTASYSYTSVNYEDTAGTGLTDYRAQTASVGVDSALGERSTASAAAYYSRYDTDPATATANNYGAAAGLDYRFSETLHGSLVAGARKTQATTTSEALVCDGPIISGICFGNITTATLVNHQSSIGYTLDAGLEQRWETATLGAHLSRQINPTGNAQLVQTDRLQIAWTYQWSPAITAYVTASGYEVQYLGSTTASNDRYYRIEPKLSWRITERWTLAASYSYSHAKYVSSSASANVAYVTLTYSWPRVSVSR